MNEDDPRTIAAMHSINAILEDAGLALISSDALREIQYQSRITALKETYAICLKYAQLWEYAYGNHSDMAGMREHMQWRGCAIAATALAAEIERTINQAILDHVHDKEMDR